MKKSKYIFSLSIFILFTASLYSETFRVAKCHKTEILPEPDFSITKKLTMNDSIAIYLPEDKLFFEGIEIKMDIPEDIALWRDCCAVYLYDDVKPTPSEEQIDFYGNKTYFKVIPGKLSWVLQIPINQNNNLKTNNYTTTVDSIPNLSENFIFLRLQQIMKGVPDEIIDLPITFTIKPILADQGILDIKFNLPTIIEYDTNPLESLIIFIDDNTYMLEHLHDGFLLDSGVHNVSIISDYFRTEVRKVRIDKAKNTLIEIDLKSIEPILLISAPMGSQVFIDDVLCEDIGKELLIAEGEHTVHCKIGDYEIVRSLTVNKGKTYKINLTVDLQLEEE